MFTLLTIGVFGAIIGLIAFEIVQESRGSHDKLTDRYHE